jgi:hypothetical protein
MHVTFSFYTLKTILALYQIKDGNYPYPSLKACKFETEQKTFYFIETFGDWGTREKTGEVTHKVSAFHVEAYSSYQRIPSPLSS